MICEWSGLHSANKHMHTDQALMDDTMVRANLLADPVCRFELHARFYFEHCLGQIEAQSHQLTSSPDRLHMPYA